MEKMDVFAHQAWDEFYTELSKRGAHFRFRGHTVQECKYYKYFEMIASTCIAKGFDPRDYVHVTLDLVSKHLHQIHPKDLTTADMVTAYAKLHAQNGNRSEYEAEWARQAALLLGLCLRCPDLKDNISGILLNAGITVEDWFRLSYLEQPTQALLDKYGESVWNEARQSVGLAKLLMKFRPALLQTLQDRFGVFIHGGKI